MLSVRAKALRTSLFLLVALLVWVVALSRPSEQTRRNKSTAGRAEGLAAWQKVYSVLTHPRCINCHTATNYPQQGDDRHRHFANVVRGPEGQGVVALQCVTCHQESNADSTGVPGGHDWHLAPLSMRWQDGDENIFSKAELCNALVDRTKNGNLARGRSVKH